MKRQGAPQYSGLIEPIDIFGLMESTLASVHSTLI